MGPLVRLLGIVFLASSAALFAGCPEPSDAKCGELEEVFVWADADGDGFGVDSIGWVCAPGAGEATNNVDCDDADATVHPSGEEVCDLVDNDCDGSIDETVAKAAWYPDADGDGFGNNQPADFACKQPSAIHLETAGDCDDNSAAVNPLALEICNAIDDDCDTLTDDSDGGVDPETKTSWYQDLDLDGYGNPNIHQERCQGPANSVQDGSDCDDNDAEINPANIEVCNGIDDDCDTLTDDYDDYVDPLTQTEFFNDADFDGYGDATQLTLSCEAVNGATDNGLDCDDNDPLVTIPTDWYLDPDLDTYGSGASLGYGCFPPSAGTAPGVFGFDCDETNPAINPGEHDVCGDGIDSDCTGSDLACGPIGSFLVENGPNWTTDPAVKNCIETCAQLFGGVDTDYHCSTSMAVQNNNAYVSGWGDATYCSGAGRPDNFKQEPPGNPGYDCGVPFCSYSAYVLDNCNGGFSRNWCWPQ